MKLFDFQYITNVKNFYFPFNFTKNYFISQLIKLTTRNISFFNDENCYGRTAPTTVPKVLFPQNSPGRAHFRYENSFSLHRLIGTSLGLPSKVFSIIFLRYRSISVLENVYIKNALDSREKSRKFFCCI